MPPMCNCNAPLLADKYHQLSCSKWCGGAWISQHDRVVDALAYECSLAGFSVTREKRTLASQYKHAGSNRVGDAFVRTDKQLLITDKVLGSRANNLMFDVTVNGMIGIDGTWSGTRNTSTTPNTWKHNALELAEKN
eukprot:CAMPEP_0113674828 /NCGR_PEP_ID=MMETSP0038_2-20120614/7662_1 /TAXON_ID=2898 /ORGANISM="Cryptomonas paramecium" /LENGTH=135 /DNA_ID=CAMNT_0000591505 /DNA_START=831 /DNA_END=1235 /DNA_ORIENTATION=- /assembly_acc=CAM_ASM_000170